MPYRVRYALITRMSIWKGPQNERRLTVNKYNIIGIDPDGSGFQCAHMSDLQKKERQKYYNYTKKDLNTFKEWVSDMDNLFIGIEGENGLNRCLEGFLRKEKIQFYSFSSREAAKAKTLFLGDHKTNEIDALGVAKLVLSLLIDGNLEKYKRLYFPNTDLRDVTRAYEAKTRQLSEAKNQLWKHLRINSPELYRLLSGKAESKLPAQFHTRKGFMNLLIEIPSVETWHKVSEEELREYLGNQISETAVNLLTEASENTDEMSGLRHMLLQQAAEDVLALSRQKERLQLLLESGYDNIPEVSMLKAQKGFGPVISTGLPAEIIDVRRFKNNNCLASYCGLGRVQHSTGDKTKEKHPRNYNHRLKNHFMTAAKCFVKYNPDSHLAGYMRHLLKRGMKITEARKRVARALVRRIYRDLMNLKISEIDQKKEAGKMANANL
jgi:hypothetical protein